MGAIQRHNLNGCFMYKEVTVYKTVDGKQHDSEQQAERHANNLLGKRLEELLISIYPDAHRPSTFKGVQALIEDREATKRVLLSIIETI